MNRRNGISLWFLALLLAACVPASAQLTPQEPDPLERIRDAARSNVQACSATGESLCEQVAPKIVANAQGDSPLAENLRLLADAISQRDSGSSADASAVGWSVAAFHEAKLDARAEKYSGRAGSGLQQENVVAEIRGREKPDEWVLVGAHLNTWETGHGAPAFNCDATMVIAAARAIALTAVHPRRSIRFVLFTGQEQSMPGSWGYVRSHRSELDRARAAIILGSRCLPLNGYSLEGRSDLEPGVREAMKPIESLGAKDYVHVAAMGNDDFDFVLEGVPTLGAFPKLEKGITDNAAASGGRSKIDISDLKRNTAIVAVTAFGIAERSEPIGARQSRSQVESLLEATGLESLMKGTSTWPQWQSGERGRQP